MRRRMNFILIIAIICSLVLTAQQNILAQAKSKQKSQRKTQETKEIKQSKGDQTERKITAKDDVKSEKMQTSGAERYRAITQNNLFMPLGSGGEVKREEFILTGTMGRSALIQMEGSGRSFFVTEGQSFGNSAQLVQVEEDSVTIIHEGNEKELELASGMLVGQGRGTRGGRTGQRQRNYGKSGRKMETANGSGKGRGSRSGNQGGDKGGGRRGNNNWARNMSREALRGVRGKIAEHIEGLRAKGITDPEEYRGALEKMEVVEDAIEERGDSK